MEIIVRIANFKFKDTHICDTTAAAVERLLETLIFPNAKFVDSETFRKKHCYNVRIQELLKKNESQIKKVFGVYTNP